MGGGGWRNYGQERVQARSWLGAGWRVEELEVSPKRVVFVPLAAPLPIREPRYGRLADYLSARSEQFVVLRLDEVETILERPLPRSAWTDRGWWGNRSGGAGQARAWMDAGWRVTGVDRAGAMVSLARVAEGDVSLGAGRPRGRRPFATTVCMGVRSF